MPKIVKTMADITIFNNDLFGSVRVTVVDNEPLFCLADICKAVELQNPSSVKMRLDPQDVQMIDLHALNSGQETIGNTIATFVTESGFYDVILSSSSPKVRPFKRWVTHDVLPAIRKSGGYIAAKAEDTPEEIMARALLVAQDTLRRREERIAMLQQENATQQEKIEQDAPKVLFAEAVSTSKTSILIGELAKVIKQNGVDMGQNRLFKWLRSNGYLCRHGEHYNTPTQKAMEMGLFEIKEHSVLRPDGSVMITRTTKVTGKGQVYFVNKFLKRA